MKSSCLRLNKPKQQQGFSLLEALIASTIFSVVLLIASSAFKFFMSMGSRSVNSEQVMQDTMNSIKMRDSIKGLHHYYLRESAISLAAAKPFFWGSQEGFTGISLNAIDFSHQPTRITVAAKKNSHNVTDLVYCEYNNKLEFPITNISVECDYPKVLAANINSVEFEYFGWSSLSALYDTSVVWGDSFMNKKKWSKQWHGKEQGLLPQYIHISIGYNDGVRAYQAKQLWFHIADADPVQFSVNSSSNDQF